MLSARIVELLLLVAGAVAFLCLGGFFAQISASVEAWLTGTDRTLAGALLRRWQGAVGGPPPATGPMALVGLGCFLLGGLLYGATPQAFAFALLSCIAMLLVEIDRRWLILPDILVAMLCLVAAAASLWAPLYPGQRPEAAALGGSMACGLLFLVRWGYQRLRHREGMGLGDVKLAFAGGVLAGPAGVPAMILVAAGATLAVAAVAATQGATGLASRRLAFGPGLCLGMLAVAVGRHYGIAVLSGTGG